MAVELNTLTSRATSGLTLQSELVFRPSWFYFMDQDPFWLWCHYHAPQSEQVDDTTRFDKYRMQLGDEWENRYVTLNFPDAYHVQARWGKEALKETLAAMLRGEQVIHGAALWLLGEEVYGKADVLIRYDDHASDLGDFHYRAKEIKNAAQVKEYHQLQAGVYHWILSTLQGYCPASFDIVLREGDGEVAVKFDTVAAEMRRQLDQWRAIRDGQLKLEPLALDSTVSPWRKYANQRVIQRQDVTLLPGVGPKTASEWRTRGFASLDDIVAAGSSGEMGRLPNQDCYYHALALQTGKPVFRPGERPSIRRRKRILHFDVEDILITAPPTVSRPHVYMIGVAEPDGSTHIWTARGEDDEVRMWTDFLDWLGDPRDVALYCWTMYEAAKLDQAAAVHPRLAEQLMAAKSVLIDLKEEIKHRPYFPVTSYSIKVVTPVCGFNWSQDDVDGLTAQLMYVDWLKTGDDTIISKVEQYNREDVLAMVAVDRYVCSLPSGPRRFSRGLHEN